MSNRNLAAAIDIRRWLADDAERPFGERLARDRAIGSRLPLQDELARVQGWWGEIEREPADSAGRSTGERVVALVRLATALLLTAGLLLGIGLGSLAFAYDGQHPVNLLALLGVLVGVPLLLLLLTLLFIVAGGLPGFAALQDTLSVINPGRWVGAWLDRFAGLRLYGGFSNAGSSFARWQLVVFSQWLAVGYFLGVLVAGWVLVAVTDLAFGWSTTLELDARWVFGLFNVLALPWQSWLPQASPDLSLVEASRFFRLESAPVTTDRAVQLGQWWPFVLMTVLIWGLLPRLLLLLIGRWRLAAATRSMLCQDPEVVALLDRLAKPRIDFGPEQNDPAGSLAGPLPEPTGQVFDPTATIVIYNGALREDAARSWLGTAAQPADGPLLQAGVSADSGALDAQLAGLRGGAERIVVFSKGWEPPLLEFADFLAALRGAVGSAATITVVPVNTRGSGVDPADREVWAGFLARHDDPRLYVVQASAERQAEHSAPAGDDSTPAGDKFTPGEGS